MLIYEELSHEIIGAAIEVHRELGPGLLESAYLECLCREFSLRKLAFERKVPLSVGYKGIRLDCGYEMDLVVDGKIVLEIKSVAKLAPIHQAQLLTYLKISKLRLGLLMNFNTVLMTDGIKRVIY
jgi:GxxExxY protein